MTEDHLICISCGCSEDIAKVPSTCPACGGTNTEKRMSSPMAGEAWR